MGVEHYLRSRIKPSVTQPAPRGRGVSSPTQAIKLVEIEQVDFPCDLSSQEQQRVLSMLESILGQATVRLVSQADKKHFALAQQLAQCIRAQTEGELV